MIRDCRDDAIDRLVRGQVTCGDFKESLASLRIEGREGPEVNFENSSSLSRVAPARSRNLITPANIVLAIGLAVLVLPTMFQVARDSWSTEQGGHGPLVLATGLWAVWRELKGSSVDRKPGNLVLGLLMLGISLGIFIVARITGILEVEAFAMYGALIWHSLCLHRIPSSRP